ncbi:D-Importin 7/RanBP7 [Aphelenchoides fujianensis]|nr:D-Importin 7/RanBP7 [Aphelenchoides fujianensis]
MEAELVRRALQTTTSAGDHSQATAYLNDCSGMIGFPLILLEILGSPEQDPSVRQAAVIYFKNQLSRAWKVDEDEAERITPISEQDKAAVRNQIIQRIVDAPEPIRVQLCVSVQYILRNDFPEKWRAPNGEGVVEEIVRLLKSDDANRNLVAMLITHRLAKIFEYKRNVDKQPFISAMHQILPLLQQRFTQLLSVATQEKMILKIFFCMVQFSLNDELFTAEQFGQWLELFVTVLKRPIPQAEVEQLDDPEDSVYWKCRKWSLKIIGRVFERYGSKGHVDAAYKEFSEYYTKNYLEPVVKEVLGLLHQYSQGVYTTPRVLALCIAHVSEAMCHANIWKMIKAEVMELFKTVLFPLLKHTDDDEELWSEDAEAYLQQKEDCFEELRSPTPAAMQLVRSICRRKGVLLEVLEFAFSKFTAASDLREVDGALNVIAALGEYLCNDRRYKKDMEKLLHMHVQPQLSSTDRFVRARALQVFSQSSEAPFSNRSTLGVLAEHGFCDPNEELPVKYEAAMAIQSFITNQEEFRNALRPHICEVIMHLLQMLETTSLDDLPAVLESVIENFEQEMIPIAEHVVGHLVKTLEHMLRVDDEGGAGDETGGITVMGLMSNLQTILYLIEDHAEIVSKVEPIVLRLIVAIFDAYAQDYFEECTAMIENLIARHVSPIMWEVYDKMCEVFETEGSMFFFDSMACFHKFVVTDTSAFLSSPERVRKMLAMCEQVLKEKDAGDDIRVAAAKMLEVMLVQCVGHLNEYVAHIIVLVMGFFAEIQGSFDEFECQLAVTLIAAFIYDPQGFVQCISGLPPHHQNNFQWFYERIFSNYADFDGIHDRIMILYAYCLGLRLPAANRPHVLVADPTATLSVFMKVFEDIKRARAAIAANESDDSDSDDDSDDDEGNNSKRNIEPDLNDSDDDLDEGEQEYMSRLLNNSDSEDDEDRHSFVEWTDMEEYSVRTFDGENARINIYNEFVTLLEALEHNDAPLYQAMIKLPEDKMKDFSELIALCRREQEHLRSRAVERSGGYAFDASAEVPSQFRFS